MNTPRTKKPNPAQAPEGGTTYEYANPNYVRVYLDQEPLSSPEPTESLFDRLRNKHITEGHAGKCGCWEHYAIWQSLHPKQQPEPIL